MMHVRFDLADVKRSKLVVAYHDRSLQAEVRKHTALEQHSSAHYHTYCDGASVERDHVLHVRGSVTYAVS